MRRCQACCSNRALRDVVDDTFNAITVDGECSTNDTVMLLANGASGITIDQTNYEAFTDAVARGLPRLALGIVRGRRRSDQADQPSP